MLRDAKRQRRAEGATMLEITTRNLGDVTIFRFIGQLVFGNEDRLLDAMSNQSRLRVLVLDLAEVTAIDAAGIGMLISLRTWAKTNGTTLKLMNLTPKTERLFELVRLTSVFESCSVPDIFALVCRALERSRLQVDTAVASHGQMMNTQRLASNAISGEVF